MTKIAAILVNYNHSEFLGEAIKPLKQKLNLMKLLLLMTAQRMKVFQC